MSLPASGNESLSCSPLDSLSEGCARHLGVDVGDNKSNQAGNYFAIATVLRSPEVSVFYHAPFVLNGTPPRLVQDFCLKKVAPVFIVYRSAFL